MDSHSKLILNTAIKVHRALCAVQYVFQKVNLPKCFKLSPNKRAFPPLRMLLHTGLPTPVQGCTIVLSWCANNVVVTVLDFLFSDLCPTRAF